MLSGANGSLRTRGGALPYHLAGLHVVRTMLEEMGGAEVVPDASDTIDMVAILRELTMPEMFEGTTSGDQNSSSFLRICAQQQMQHIPECKIP